MIEKTAQLNGDDGAVLSKDENVLALYLSEISRVPLLSREEEDAAARVAASGNKAARNKLVTANLRFVVNVAKKYQGRGLPLADLINEGNIGLMRAVKMYDPDKGYHFISYAVWWIRQSILKAICEKSRMIRIPPHRAEELAKIERVRKGMRIAGGVQAENREIAWILNKSLKRVDRLVEISRDPVSLERPLSDDKEASLVGDFVEDPRRKPPEAAAIEEALKSDIEKALGTLDKKEADIIRCRYGLGGGGPMTLEEIGDRFNLTKERIRQIENKALKRLRHPRRARLLAAYVA